MKVIDPGHGYLLDRYDGAAGSLPEFLDFFKRVGPGYPGNEGPPHGGTNCQEVLRVLIDRIRYLDGQEAHHLNEENVQLLRRVLLNFEIRAHERRDRRPFGLVIHQNDIESVPTCPTCGHTFCERHKEKAT